MANLKEVRTRISSVKSTQQITKAMKMVSAAKLRRAQSRIVQMRPYAEKIKEMIGGLSGSIGESSAAKYFEQREGGRVLLVAVAADRGLCGGFNSSVLKATKALIKEKFSSEQQNGLLDIYCVGKKGNDHFSKLEGFNVVGSHDGIFQSFGWEDAENIASGIMERFSEGEYDKVMVVYNRFKNAAVYMTTTEQYLPVEAKEDTAESTEVDYIFEPSKSAILEDLIPRSLKTNFFKYLLDSNAAEHGARMTAMDNATENAEELLRTLSIEYNKARQAAITGEILEIVGGAAALEG